MESFQATKDPFRFASFELHVRSRELRKGTTRIHLQEQPFEILRLMLERPGHVVTREELCRRLWPQGTFVDFEHSLNAAIKRLRAALGDDAIEPRFVETVPRRGYRFIAPVQAQRLSTGLGTGPSAGPGAAAPAALPASLPSPDVRVAVLPFTNFDGDAVHDYFADGLTEETIAQLGTLCRDKVGVVARWSSMAFKGSAHRVRQIGEALRVGYLLEGSVRRDGQSVRITARLVETAGETQVWSHSYDRDAADYLSVQADIASRIARSLATQLTPAAERRGAPPPDGDAYQAYLKGRFYWNKPGDEGLEQALAFFGEGLRIAPTFAAAHAARARAMVARAEYYRDLPRRALATADDSARRAIELDPDQPEAQLALGDVHRLLHLDWAAAQACYREAIALNPGYEGSYRSYALLLSARGQHREALSLAARACELDPFCLVVGVSAAWVSYACGDYEAAIRQCRYTLELDPAYRPAGRLLAAACLAAGSSHEARDAFEAATRVDPHDPVLLAWRAHAYGITGARGEALRLIDAARAASPARYVSAFHLALAYVGVGDVDAAWAALAQAYDERDPVLACLNGEPRLEPLRRDARYARLLQRLKLGEC